MFFRISAAFLGAIALAFVPVEQALADGYKLMNVMITSYAGGKAVAQTRTDANGEFVFKDLAPGTYTLKIDGPSLTTAVAKSKQTTRSSTTPPAGQALPPPAAGRAATGGKPAVGDYDDDGPGIIGVLVALLLPAVQKNAQAAPAPQSFRQQATKRGAEITFTVPASVGPVSSWKGTLERQR